MADLEGFIIIGLIGLNVGLFVWAMIMDSTIYDLRRYITKLENRDD